MRKNHHFNIFAFTISFFGFCIYHVVNFSFPDFRFIISWLFFNFQISFSIFRDFEFIVSSFYVVFSSFEIVFNMKTWKNDKSNS